MLKTLLAAAAAFALASAVPAYAGCANCDDCPHKVASADKAEKKDGPAKTACGCPGHEKGECKCAAHAAGKPCECGHCHPKHDHKKAEEGKKA